METIDLELMKRFIAFRKKHIGNQVDAAGVCECSQKHISEIESGKTSISLKIAFLLYKKKQLNIFWFFGEKAPMQRKPESKESLVTNVAELKGEIDVMSKYIEQMQKVLNKVVKDVYSKSE